MRVLFFYTELADYFLKCCEELSKTAEVHIIRWPINKEAPFQFSVSEHLKIYDKNKYSFIELTQLTQSINPNIIICSGWVDKEYLKITKLFSGRIPTVLTLDTHWRASLKQKIACLLSPFFIRNIFSHAWVPGHIQQMYALKLGFKKEHIYLGFYCCNLPVFNSIYTKHAQQKLQHFPKVFLYTGRYYDFKGISDLWEAFIQVQNESANEWELWCLGNGSIPAVIHPKIKHFGFVQPQALEPIIQQCGVFVLPSRFEPWGVVVQEYASAGFPLLLSNEVGAAESFLQVGTNGYSFSAGNIDELKVILKKIINSAPNALNLMAENSHKVAQKITQQNWAKTVHTIKNGFKQN